MKMKKIFRTCAYVLIAIFALGLIAGLLARLAPQDEPSSESSSITSSGESSSPEDSSSVEDSSSSEVQTYAVTYRMVKNGSEEDIPEFLFDEDGSYPTTYIEGRNLAVSDLAGEPFVYVSWSTGEPYTGKVYTVGGCDYEFFGWFLDLACTQEFARATELVGDVTLYAKVQTAVWIGPY